MYEADFEFNTTNIQADLILNVTPDKLSQLTNDTGFITSAELIPLENDIIDLQNNKVDKIEGKGLSTNDFTNAFKSKLEGIEAGAEVNTVYSVNGQTGDVVIDIPEFAVESVNGKTGEVVLTASDVNALADTTTIGDLTTTAQMNAINSGATTTNIGQISTNTANISDINSLIPSQATTSNQLADKNFVNSSIETNTANFIGTFNSVAELEAYSGTLTNNDYAFVIGTDADGNTVYNRYKYNADGQEWLFEYALNNSSFTAAQWAAINSNATTTNIAQITTNQNAIGTLSLLTTTAKTNLVSAVNEVNSEVTSIAGGSLGQVFVKKSDTNYDTEWQSADNLRMYNKDAFTVVGSPTITDDGIASGFSGDDYLYANITHSGNLIKFHFEMDISVNENKSPFAIYSTKFNTIRYDLTTKTLQIWDDNTYAGTVITGALTDFTNIKCDIEINLTTNALSSIVTNKNNQTVSYTSTISSDVINVLRNITKVYFGKSKSWQHWADDSTIDLKSFQITVDNQVVFNGSIPLAKRFISDVQVDGSTVVNNNIAVIPIAAQSGDYGLVKFGSTISGIQVASGTGNIAVYPATTSNIDDKTNNYRPIVPSNLDYAVKVGVTTNTNTLTDAEKTDACSWIGALPNDIYGVSTTAAATVQKEVSIPSIKTLNAGQLIIVKPTVTSTVADSTLKLNDFDPYPMLYAGNAITTSTDSYVWYANAPVWWLFDGSNWLFAGHGYDYNTTYSAMTQANIIAGTETSGKLMRSDYLKNGIFGVVTSYNSGASITLSDKYLYNNTSNITALTLVAPSSPDVRFLAQVNFSSGSTATTFSYPTTFKVIDGCDDTQYILGVRTFVPVANKRYQVFIESDGVNLTLMAKGV